MAAASAIGARLPSFRPQLKNIIPITFLHADDPLTGSAISRRFSKPPSCKQYSASGSSPDAACTIECKSRQNGLLVLPVLAPRMGDISWLSISDVAEATIPIYIWGKCLDTSFRIARPMYGFCKDRKAERRVQPDLRISCLGSQL